MQQTPPICSIFPSVLCILSVCARDAVTLLQSWGCWYVDKAARQSVGAGGTEAHWASVGVESRSAADYTAESN